MNKNLINSEKEFLDLFIKADLAEWEIENLLSIEFALSDGTYKSDWVKGVEIDEDQDVDWSKYKTWENSIFPESYPCVVVHSIEERSDRFGSVKFRMFEFVYLNDFEGTQNG